ncbi:hypothetical protein HMN09_00675800 [Mycena chlorophos]|uniref:Uncharacterized protein n=1 Tax=Mycena chlorophos TaxID=658473 RepID=A0A8H6SYE2_MYCCL|nr:hypothetical protein HMN09_00675800 [Mycena chlorophos]
MSVSNDIIEIEDSDSEIVQESSNAPSESAAEKMSSVAETSGDILEQIKARLTKVLRGGLAFNGNIACIRRYEPKDVPNPFLTLAGVGVVGLPLSEHEAARIISSFNDGEIPSSKIAFENPEWDAWVKETAACKAFDSEELVGDQAPRTTPTFKLRKLVVRQGPKMSATTNACSSSATGAIGEIFIALPSAHVGGQLAFSHETESFTAELDEQSGFITSVVASFAGVTCTTSPIASGYQLGLVYDILPRAGSEPIKLPDTHTLSAELRDALSAWTSSSVSDARLHILLAEKYANESCMGRQTLVGGDAHFWRHLEPVIMQLGLHVFFADIEVKIEDTASVDSGEGDDPWDAIGEDDFYFNMEDQLGDGYGELKVVRTWSKDGMLLDVPNANFAIQDLVEEDDVQAGIVRFGGGRAKVRS